jgi:hypothetical protein
MAKKSNSENETYIVEEIKQSKLRDWLSSRGAKITAISVGSALAIGTAFTGGVIAAKSVLPHHDGPGFAEGFDRDGDHRESKPDHDERGEAHEGYRDGDKGGEFQIDPNQTSVPSPTTTTP